LSEVAKDRGIEITPKLIENAEKMIENEFRTKTPTFLSTNIAPNILSVFELNLNE
jgi:hypothetical protein